MGKTKIVSKFIHSRFSILITGIVAIIIYYLSNESYLNIFYLGVILVFIGLLVINHYNRKTFFKNTISSSVNGIGTTFYGKREIELDGSYITTKWFIFLLLPIYPISSYRVLPNKPIMGLTAQTISYKKIEKISLNKKQIINIYLLVYGFIIIIFIILPVIIYILD